MNWYPDPNADAHLRRRQLSLEGFNQLVNGIWNKPENVGGKLDYELIQAILAGRAYNSDREREERLFVNARMGHAMPEYVEHFDDPPDATHYGVTRDIDSMFGMTRDLPYTCAIHVYPVCDFRQTLKKDIHITWPVRINGATKNVGLHEIPNMCFAKIGTHAKVNIMFPGLYAPGQTRKIDDRRLDMVYEMVIRPSLLTIGYEHIGHWPPTAKAAWALIRGVDGGLTFKTISIPNRRLEPFATEMCRRMDLIPEFQDAFWYHEVRGTKGNNHHNPHNDDEAADALHLAFKDLNFLAITPNDLAYRWFVDVGIEVRHPGHVLHWRRESHASILEHAMPSALPAGITNLLGGSNFTLDACAQLDDIAGFRAITKHIGLIDNVRYINVYSTEKELHYQILKGTYKEIQPSDFLPANIQRTLNRIDQWTTALNDAMGHTQEAQEAAARYELRVPAAFCGAALREVPYDVLKDACVSIEARTWWAFKYWRIFGCYLVISNLQRAPSTFRVAARCLQLGATMAYILNSALYRTNLSHPWPELETAVAMYHDPTAASGDEMDDDMLEGDEMVPIGGNQGLFFLAAIEKSKRFFTCNDKRVIDMGNLLYLYGADNVTTLNSKFGITGIKVIPRRAHANRRSNRQPMTSSALAVRTEPLPVLDLGGVQAAERGGEPQLTLTNQIGSLWAQWKHDLLEKAPQRRLTTNPRYMTTTALEIANAPTELFQSPELPFQVCRVILVDPTFWTGQLLDLYFPPAATFYQIKKQNYTNCLYWGQYGTMTERMTAQQVELLRGALKRLIGTLLWVPYPESDRFWVTRTTGHTTAVYVPRRGSGPAPLLALNPFKYKGQRLSIRRAIDYGHGINVGDSDDDDQPGNGHGADQWEGPSDPGSDAPEDRGDDADDEGDERDENGEVPQEFQPMGQQNANDEWLEGFRQDPDDAMDEDERSDRGLPFEEEEESSEPPWAHI
ncbi:hypothetical protein EVJ58_g9127 [Rhodofomes roseus]|uniref:Uncharacterized protein n=1 Tax=Rhodofomes roseus TaxID=34475 RepID=A0A4Y9XX36_9APHY|nr:hypothetical protein EVJ58_g9127 [Rhodofomes roseus]